MNYPTDLLARRYISENVRINYSDAIEITVEVKDGNGWKVNRRFHCISDDYAHSNAQDWAKELVKTVG